MFHNLLITLIDIFKLIFQNSNLNLSLVNNSINANLILSFTPQKIAHQISCQLLTSPDQFSYQIILIVRNSALRFISRLCRIFTCIGVVLLDQSFLIISHMRMVLILLKKRVFS